MRESKSSLLSEREKASSTSTYLNQTPVSPPPPTPPRSFYCCALWPRAGVSSLQVQKTHTRSSSSSMFITNSYWLYLVNIHLILYPPQDLCTYCSPLFGKHPLPNFCLTPNVSFNSQLQLSASLGGFIEVEVSSAISSYIFLWGFFKAWKC